MPSVDTTTTSRYGPEDSAAPGQFKPGDFILTHGGSLFSYLIRFGQRYRFLGKNRTYAHWSHAALIVSTDGDIIEAIGPGVREGHLREYELTEYCIVSLGDMADDRDRAQMVAFARSCLGLKYGVVTTISIVFGLLSGATFKFWFDGQYICSGLVARALERTNALLPRSPSHTLPADLAKYFRITADASLPKGTAPHRKFTILGKSSK